MSVTEQEFDSRIEAAHARVAELRQEIGRLVIGQQALVDRLIISLLVRGHLLIEGLPGLAKTLVVKSLAAAIGGSFKRVQFTPDLLPADLTGTLIFDPAGGNFNVRLGPIFANLVLADEINRAPAKVQSALLEAMQERQVTIGDTTHRLPEPFVVIATQNPIEQEGTYSLPEAQVDRFVMKTVVGYPSREEERKMLSLYLDPVHEAPQVRRVATLEEITALAELAAAVHVDERIAAYIVDLVHATRRPGDYGLASMASQIEFGASPRATLALAHVTKGYAFLQGRAYVVPEDVKALAGDVLRHRMMLSYEATADQVTADQLIEQLLRTVPVP
jgi:MoxR-like ATPase